jgi:hypothetical protein
LERRVGNTAAYRGHDVSAFIERKLRGWPLGLEACSKIPRIRGARWKSKYKLEIWYFSLIEQNQFQAVHVN